METLKQKFLKTISETPHKELCAGYEFSLRHDFEKISEDCEAISDEWAKGFAEFIRVNHYDSTGGSQWRKTILVKKKGRNTREHTYFTTAELLQLYKSSLNPAKTKTL